MKENRSETVPFFFFFLNVLIREAGCMHKQGMCYRPLSFVWEARVQQGLTAWAFKGVSLAGTKTQPLHHEESDNLINVTIYSTRPSACPTAPQMLSHWPLYRAPTQQPFEFPLICADGSEKGGGSGTYSTCKNICLNSFAAVPLGAPSTTLYPLDRGGALFSSFFAAAFTVSLLHFSPLATFDALGPQLSLPVVCVRSLFLFFPVFFPSLSFPLRAPSLSFCRCPSSSLSLCLFPPLGLWKWSCWLHGNRSHTSCPPPLWGLFRLVRPRALPPPPPPPPFLPFTASIWCVRSEFGSSGRSRRSRRSFDCLGGLSVCLKDGSSGGTDILLFLWTNAPLLRAVRLVILWRLRRWLHPRRLSFPSLPYKFPFAFVFQAWLIILVCPSLFEFSHVFLTPWAGFRRIIPPFAT